MRSCRQILQTKLLSSKLCTYFYAIGASYSILKLIINKQIPIDTKITLNWVEVKDVAMGVFSGLQQEFDISKSRRELGFNPKALSRR